MDAHTNPAATAGLISSERMRGAALEIAWVAGHLVLYPTGLLPWGRTSGENPSEQQNEGDESPTTPTTTPNASRNTRTTRAQRSTRTRRPKSRTKNSQEAPLPVVLVHGLFDNRAVFAPLRRVLRRHGCGPISAMNHNPLAGDVPSKAAVLNRHIEQVCEFTGAPGVHVIGHSLGGLVARYQAQILDEAHLVRTVVTMATPHHGTRSAYLLRAHPLVRQLCPGSPLLAELDQPSQCPTRFLAFWGDLDPLVLPCASGALRHPDLDAVSVLVPGAGHLSLPASGAVINAIRDAVVPSSTEGRTAGGVAA